MFCSQCGARVPDGSKFCPACGSPTGVAGAAGVTGTVGGATGVSAAPTGAQSGASAHVGSPTGPAPTQAGIHAAPTQVGAHVAPAPGRDAAAYVAHRRVGAPKLPLVAGAGVAALVVVGVLVWNLFLSPYAIDEKNFPDAAVRNVVISQLDTDRDGKLSRSEAAAVTSLTVNGATSVSGLGRFLPNLEALELQGTSTTSVDVSDLGRLTTLKLTGTGLASVDTSKNGRLQTLDVSGSPVTALDLSHNGELVSLQAAGSALTAIDVSGTPKLQTLNVDPSVQVSGLEATGLREVALVSKVDSTDSYDGKVSQSIEIGYNSDGTVSSRKVFNRGYSSGNLGRQTAETFAYDQGRLVSSQEDASRGIVNHTYEYDGEGRISADNGDDGSYHKYTYDDAGRLVQLDERNVYSGSSSTSSTAYAYDDAGHLVKEASTYSYGGEATTYAFGYDEQGRVTSYEIPYGDGNIRVSLTYDDAGRVATGTTAYPNSSGANPLQTFSYDDAGRLIKVRDSYNASTTDYTDYDLSYDDAGRLVKVRESYASGGAAKESTAWDLIYEGRAFVAKDAADPTAGATFKPTYLHLDDVPTAGIFLPNPGAPADPDPFSLEGMASHY